MIFLWTKLKTMSISISTQTELTAQIQIFQPSKIVFKDILFPFNVILMYEFFKLLHRENQEMIPRLQCDQNFIFLSIERYSKVIA